VGTTSGSEHTTRQNRTEVKPDGAREISWGEGAGVALCGCGRPLSGDGGGQGVRDLNSEPGQGRSHREACVCPMIGHGVGGGVCSGRSDSGVVQGQRRRGGVGAMWRRRRVGLARWGGAVGVGPKCRARAQGELACGSGLWRAAPRPLAGRSAAFPHTYFIWMNCPFLQPGGLWGGVRGGDLNNTGDS
jgi:hypothetical protein